MLLELFEKAPEAWVGLAGVIFGSLLTTFGVWLTNRANAKQVAVQLQHEEVMNRQRVKKERLEELYSLVFNWGGENDVHLLYLKLVLEGRISVSDYHKEIQSRANGGIDNSRIAMISEVYGGEIESARQKLALQLGRINEFKNSSLKSLPLNPDARVALLVELEAEVQEFGRLCSSFKYDIAEAARKL